MNLETLNGEKVTSKDILDALKFNYHDTINILENTVINYDNYDEDFFKELYKILKDNNYFDSNMNEFNKSCPIAYYLSLSHNFEEAKMNIAPRFRVIPEFIAKDMFRLEGLSLYIVFTKVNERLKGVYSKVLDDEFMYKEIITKMVNYCKVLPRVGDVLESFEADTKEKEKIFLKCLKNGNIDISDNKGYLKDPVALAYFLVNDYENTIKCFENNFDLEANKKVSSKILDKIASCLAKNKYFKNNDMSENIPSFYMLVAALKRKVITIEEFNEYFKRADDVNVSLDNMDMLMDILKDYKIDKNFLYMLINYGYMNNLPLAYKDDVLRIINVIKEYNIPSSFIIDAGYNEYLFKENNLLTDEEIYWINNTDYSEDNEKALLKKLGGEYSSLELYIGNKLKDKNINDLSVYEVSAIRIFANKVKVENGLNTNIDFSYRSVRSLGDYNNLDKSINVSLGINPPVKGVIQTIYHELNHAIQFRNIENMNIEDEDILEYSKDWILQHMLGYDYYKEEYLSLSYEFDADCKAKIQTAVLFNDIEDLFITLKDGFNQEYKTIRTDYIGYKRTFKRNGSNINQIFSLNLLKYKNENKSKYDNLVEYIKVHCPIIGYEYDLDTGIKKSMQELLSSYENAIGRDKEIYKYIIHQRCNLYKAGREEANESYTELVQIALYNDKLSECLTSIKINKDRLQKYTIFSDKLINDIENKIISNKDRSNK